MNVANPVVAVVYDNVRTFCSVVLYSVKFV